MNSCKLVRINVRVLVTIPIYVISKMLIFRSMTAESRGLDNRFRAFSMCYLKLLELLDIYVYLIRKIYPVVILGKASLGWNVDYMRRNWQSVATLGVLPWAVEVTAVAACANLTLDFPWLWGKIT